MRQEDRRIEKAETVGVVLYYVTDGDVDRSIQDVLRDKEALLAYLREV